MFYIKKHVIFISFVDLLFCFFFAVFVFSCFSLTFSLVLVLPIANCVFFAWTFMWSWNSLSICTYSGKGYKLALGNIFFFNTFDSRKSLCFSLVPVYYSELRIHPAAGVNTDRWITRKSLSISKQCWCFRMNRTARGQLILVS